MKKSLLILFVSILILSFTVALASCGDSDRNDECSHTQSEWITDKDATCKEAGSKHKECTECEEILETAVIDKHSNHTPGEAVTEDYVDSTCTAEGSYNHVVYCTVCEIELSQEAKVVEKKAHTESDWIIDKDATCKEAGSKHKECTECEEILETAVIDKHSNHTPGEAVTEDYVDSTCTAEGSYNLVVYCTVCEIELSQEAKVVEKKAHTESDWIIDKDATCKEAGSKHKECAECEEILETAVIDKHSNHTPGEAATEDYVDSTCTAEGSYNLVVYCTVCEIELSQEAKVVEKKAHTEAIDYAVVPTCTSTGLTEGKHCSVCEKILVAQEIIKMLEHTYSEALSSNNTHHYHECSCGAKNEEEQHTSSGAATAENDEVCTVCGYVINKAVGIKFNTLIANGNKIYTKVSNDTDFYSFIGEVVTVGNAKYIVSYKIDGREEITTKTLDLDVGDNTVYITEYINGEPTYVYIVTIRRRPMYEVTFNSNGGTAVDGITLEEDSLIITAPKVTRPGYTFVSWDYDFSNPITANTHITAEWKANEDTAYTVEYYLENTDKNGYDLKETLNLVGTTDTTATAEQKIFEHFTFDASSSIISGNIDGDDNLVLKVYYTRDTYNVSTAVNSEKGGTTKGDGIYIYEQEITLTATTKAGYTFIGWFEGDKKVCDTLAYTFNIDHNATYTAKFEANTDTKYTVEYYTETLENGEYTIFFTVTGESVTDTELKAVIKEFEHFTFNPDISTVVGNIEGDGSLVLKVYYTRDSYDVSTEVNNEKAGSVTVIGDKYKYEEKITVTATTNPGYTFIGWFDGDKKVGYTLSCTLEVDHNATYTAKFEANTDTKYTVEYYLENLEDSGYTLAETLPLTGTTDTEANATVKDFEHFTFTEAGSILSGNIHGDGSLVLKVYYTRNSYNVSTESSNEKAGSVTVIGNSYRYETEISVTASINLGYNFIGWFDGDTKVSENLTYTFCVDHNATYVAKFEVKPEMTGFTFTSTRTDCTITGIKDKTILEISVPDYVTSIGSYAFKDCTNLTNVRIPDSNISIDKSAFEGCESLSYNEYDNAYYLGNESNPYLCLLKAKDAEIIICIIHNSTKIISGGAFENSASLKSIMIPESVTKIPYGAFSNCTSLSSVYYTGTEESFANITVDFENQAFINAVTYYDYELPEDFEWTLTNTEIEIVCYIGNSSEVVIPKDILGFPVTSIGVLAFTHQITSVTIPYGIKSIAESAFWGCTTLTNVTIPDSVTSIGSSAFWGCESLKSVTVGSGVTTIGDKVFKGCSGLEAVTIRDGATSVGTFMFADCTSLTNITIPDSVTSIGANAFDGCISLTSIIIPSTVSEIAPNTFSGCRGLTTITIPKSVTKIGEDAFADCSSLTDVYYIGSLEEWNKINIEIGFEGYATGNINLNNANIFCLSLSQSSSVYEISNYQGNATELIIPEEIGGIHVKSIGHYAFEDCSSLTSIVIPDSVTWIGEYAFGDCTSLVSVTLGAAVKDIKDTAFNCCYKLVEIINLSSLTISAGSWNYGEIAMYAMEVHTGESKIVTYNDYLYYSYGGVNYLLGYVGTDTSLALPESYNGENYEIYKYAFYNCAALKDATIPDSVTAIGNKAFYGCTSLESVNIGNGVTTIGANAFRDCTALTSVTIPDSVTILSIYVFFGCSSLKNVSVGNGVTTIGTDAFKDCTSLESVNIGNSVTSIGKLFYSLTSLKSITIGNGVTSIDASAFEHCSSLTNVTIGNGVTSIGDYAFRNCSSLTSINIPDGVTSIGNRAFSGCSSLESVTIPDKVTTIGPSAFRDCASLKSINIPSSVTRIEDSAFYGCNSLTGVYITNVAAWCNINYVGSNPLHFAKNLYLNGELVTELVIPEGVTMIGVRTFKNCTSLTSVTIPDSIQTIREGAFEGCENLKSVTIGNGVATLENYIFKDCVNLTNIYISDIAAWCNISNLHFVTTYGLSEKNLYLNGELVTELIIPDGITHIGEYTFFSFSFTSVTIPDSVKWIGRSAFYGCRGITSITIPNSLKTIGDYAFYKCDSLTDVYYVGSEEDWAKISIGSNNTPLTNATIYYFELAEEKDGYALVGYKGTPVALVIPEKINGISVTSVGNEAFLECTSLESVTIPNSVTTIGNGAFINCESLTSVVIGNGVTVIGDDAFRGCALTSITIPSSVTTIGNWTFETCRSLTSITISDSVTSIGEGAFDTCSSLTDVYYTGSEEDWNKITIGSNNTALTDANIQYNYLSVIQGLAYEISSDGTYYTVVDIGSCTDTDIVIPSTYKRLPVKAIGDLAFYNCTSLTSVTIGNSVTSIGESAFYYCTSLTSITIPNSVTSIGEDAFSGCLKLVEVINKSALNIEAGSGSYGDIGYYALEVHSGESKIVNKDDYLFYTYNGVNYLLGYIGTDTALTLPESYNGENYEIYKCAFDGCTSLTSVTIGNSVTFIGNGAFASCTSLTSITIPDSVTSIGWFAFRYCSSLTSITIPDSVTSIGSFAFEGCSSLTDVYYAGTKEDWAKISIDYLYNTPLTNATKHYNYNQQ